MTETASPPPPPSAVTINPNPWSNGARFLFWGACLTAFAALLIVLGSQPSSDGSDTTQPVLVLGWVMSVIAAPVLLIGIIAVGVRMGLQDHEGS